MSEPESDEVIHQLPNLTGPMLTIPVDLHRDIVPVQCSVSITGLHRPPDAQVEWQTHHRRMGRHLPKRVIGRPIVDHQHVKMRQRPMQAMRQPGDRLTLIERRYDHQSAELGMGRMTAAHKQVVILMDTQKIANSARGAVRGKTGPSPGLVDFNLPKGKIR